MSKVVDVIYNHPEGIVFVVEESWDERYCLHLITAAWLVLGAIALWAMR